MEPSANIITPQEKVCYFILYSYEQLLLSDEIKRERDFYRARNLPCPKDAALAADKPGADEPEQQDNTDCHRKDEQVMERLLVT